MSPQKRANVGFGKSWLKEIAYLPLTAFHAAASIKCLDRNLLLYDQIDKVNVGEIANVMNSVIAAGAIIFISTSTRIIPLSGLEACHGFK